MNLNSKIKWLYNQSFCIETLFNIKAATRTKINPKTTSFKFSVDPNLRNLKNNSILFKSKGTDRFQMTSIFLSQKACLHSKASFPIGVYLSGQKKVQGLTPIGKSHGICQTNLWKTHPISDFRILVEISKKSFYGSIIENFLKFAPISPSSDSGSISSDRQIQGVRWLVNGSLDRTTRRRTLQFDWLTSYRF